VRDLIAWADTPFGRRSGQALFANLAWRDALFNSPATAGVAKLRRERLIPCSLRETSCPSWLDVLMSISDNIAAVRQRLAAAARRAGRVSEEIALIAVTKTVEPARIRAAYEAGLQVFGENRVQEFAGKAAALADLLDAKWHMIGHLQTNKTVKAAELFVAVDSIDSLKLAEKLNAAAEKLGKKLAVLIEINVGGEAAKSGIAMDSPEIDKILRTASQLQSLSFQGLMTVPPFTDDPQGARPYFRKLRELRDALAKRRLPSVSLDVLSMGMSHDFEVAIEEGSTCVRVGTAIFGERVKA
jgi:pyridoxal phosphate enzyme (YggS family)